MCDRRRKTPLHHAAVNGDPAVVELFLSHGADLHAKDEYGCKGRLLTNNAGVVRSRLLERGYAVAAASGNAWTTDCANHRFYCMG